jgi:hypothetical protein
MLISPFKIRQRNSVVETYQRVNIKIEERAVEKKLILTSCEIQCQVKERMLM